MPPGPRTGEVPPFHRIGEYLFQDLCRDLLDAERLLSTCDIYGERGDTQDGIDLRGYRRDGDGIEVGQCKAYQDFPAREIKAASDEFFKHWDARWSKENVKRFVLFVACTLDRRKQQDQIEEERKRFAAVGVRYEAWSAATIRNKLRSHKGIVATYCKPAEFWVPEICGEPWVVSGAAWTGHPRVGALSAVVEENFEQLATRVSGDVRRQLDAMRERWMEGGRSDVRDWIVGLRGDRATWTVLPADVKADLLRFEASVGLDQPGGLDRAEELAVEADALDPRADGRVLRALIAYRKEGIEPALSHLEGESTIRALNLQAALELAGGHLDAARNTLLAAAGRTDSNAETFRLMGLLRLAEGDADQARLEVQKAEERSPNWTTVRHTAAMVDYYSALSPAALRRPLGGWPEPVDWAFVRRDGESTARLRRAGARFGGLLSEIEAVDERRELETWELACLANDAERQDDAIARCRALLISAPDHFRVMAWAAARRYPVDLGPSEAVVERAVQESRAELDAIVALVGTYLATRRPKRAVTLLDRTLAIFGAHGADELWQILRAQAAPQGRQRGRLRADLAADTEPARVERLVALRAGVHKRGGAQRLAAFLQERYARTGDARYLLERCQVLAAADDWRAVAEHADELVGQIATADAVRLAAYASFNARQYARSAALLDAQRQAFPGGTLPSELRRLRAAALQAAGQLPDALTEAEAVAQDDPSTANLLRLAELHLARGDLLSLSVLARRLRERSDLPRGDALRIAARVHLEDRGLAQALWRQAASGDVPDALVASLVGLAFELGLEQDVAPFMARLQELAARQQGGVRVMPLGEFTRMAQQWRDRTEEVLGAYRRGEVPCHLVASSLNRPLSEFYHRIPRLNRASSEPHRQFAILVRHGRRSAPSDWSPADQSWRLHLDLTALLVAADIEILDVVEQTFKPLRIAPELQPALLQMRERVAEQQLTRLEAAREILRLLDEGAYGVYEPSDAEDLGRGSEWTALLTAAQREGGYLADYLPIQQLEAEDPLRLPEDAARYLVNCRAIVDGLRANGALTFEEAERATERFGQEGRAVQGVATPEPGSILYCHLMIPETLATAGVLRAACSSFRLRIERREVERCRGLVREYEESQEDARWLAELIDRVRQGIDNGTYAVLPFTPPEAGEDAETADERDPTMRGLLTLLRSQLEQGDALWADDRYSTRFLNAGAARVIGVLDVLQALREVGAIDDAALYSAMHRLRASNVRLLPAGRGDILHHLARAPQRQGTIAETVPLRVLRKYLASCVLQADMLQLRPLPGEDALASESSFLVEAARAVDGAIGDLWRDQQLDERTRLLRAEWLLTYLHTDFHALADAAGVGADERSDRYRVAAGLVSMLIHAIDMRSRSPGAGSTARRRYFEWLDQRIIQQRLDADPQLLPLIAKIFRDVALSLLESEPMSTLGGAATVRALQELHGDLPPTIRNELGKEAEFMARIGLVTVQGVVVAGRSFERQDYWRAAAEAVNGRAVSVAALEADTVVVFRPHVLNSRPCFAFEDRNTGQLWVFGGEEVELLLDSPEAREAALRRVPHWFDLPKDEFEHEVARIASLDDPILRVFEAKRWRDTSAGAFYRGLTDDLRRHDEIDLRRLLPPDGPALVRYYRLSDNVDARFSERWHAAAVRLLEDEGLATALWRCFGIPVPLPSVLVDALLSLPATEQRAVLRELLHQAPTPIGRIHLASLLGRMGGRNPAYWRLARWLLKSLVNSSGREALDAFTATLIWSGEAFSRWAAARAWPADVGLAAVWGHAHELFSALVAADASLSWVREVFGERALRVGPEWFQRDPAYWRDIAHPRRVSPEAILLGGFAYALRETPEQALDEPLRDRIVDVLFPGEPGDRCVSRDLLFDATLAGDLLGSFLAGRRDEHASYLVQEDVAALLAPEAMRATAEAALRPLAETADPRQARVGWVQAYAVLLDLPPPAGLMPHVSAALAATDLTMLGECGTQAAVFAARATAAMAGPVGDTAICQHLGNEIVRLARFFAGRVAGTRQVDQGGSGRGELLEPELAVVGLLQAALDLHAGLSGTLDETVAGFATMAGRLADAWPSQSSTLGAILVRLAEGLPITTARPLWMVILRTRTL